MHLKWGKDTRKNIEVDAGERLEAAEVAEDRSDDFLGRRGDEILKLELKVR